MRKYVEVTPMRLAALILLVGLSPMTGFAQQPAAAPASIRSPELQADRHVTFRLLAPKATEVRLRGDFLKSPEALRKDEKGLWSVTVGPIRPDIYAYEFLVDGVRTIDPNNPSVKRTSLAMQTSSWLEVPGDSPMYYDNRPVPHGAIHVRWYRSKSLDSERRMHVYTPPNYDSGSAKYPVLYLLHGAGGDDSVWMDLGQVNLILDNLIADHKIAPMVVAMTFGYGYPPLDPSHNAASQREGYTKDLISDVIPFIQANYRTQTGREDRAIAGLSMGGGQALTIALQHPELFSRVAGYSAGFTQGTGVFQELVANPKKVNDQLKLIWVGCGTEDRLFPANKQFSEFLTKSGVKNMFRSSEGNHTWQIWRQYFYESVPLLFPPRNGV